MREFLSITWAFFLAISVHLIMAVVVVLGTMDWSPFNGMRTISANIAVELPEAPHQGTLYRVLFLSGLLLFIATFCINSLAEVVRQRLRDKYNRL